MPVHPPALRLLGTPTRRLSLVVRTALLLVFVLALALGQVGCANMETGSHEVETTQVPPPPMDNYYDFDDVPVPQEMELETKESFILETPNEKSGVMVFSGPVEIQSLRDYYINSMAREGWTMRSAIKSSRTILVFEKPARYCIVTLQDNRFKTSMEIWVTPRSGALGAPMPAFGDGPVYNEQPLPQ